MIFFDFAAAFPSLAHAFLWLALEMMGVPPWMIAALKACYIDCWHWLKHGRVCLRVFEILAGVKQGCPLSPLLFVMVTDPFIRAIKSVLSPRSAIRAYADDIAIVVSHLWREGPSIAALFNLYERITCLALKPAKCVLIPLWKYNAAQVKDFLLELLPVWLRFKVADKALYLGLWVGPGSGDKSWDAAKAKYLKRVETLLSFKAGVWITCMLYRVFAMSSLTFVAQCKRIPAHVFELERKTILRILRGPRHWISLPVAFHMDKLFAMPGAFPSLQAHGLAAKLRLALTVFPDLELRKQALETGLLKDDNVTLASLGNRTWWNDSIVFVLHDAVKEATEFKVLSRGCPTDPEVAAALKPEGKKHCLQKWLALGLTNAMYPVSPSEFFRQRFARWDSLLAGGAQAAADRVPSFLQHVKKRVPPAVLAAWMHSALNGWCTARRFQCQGQCRLSKNCRGEDS
jgi:hypothetical protein